MLIIAKIAAAATITHLTQMAGHQNMAKTTIASAKMNRQKQSFMSSPPDDFRLTDHTVNHGLKAIGGSSGLGQAGAARETDA